MPIYVHHWFLGWLKFDLPLCNGLLNMQAEDSRFIRIMISNIVKLVVFFPLSSLAEGIT